MKINSQELIDQFSIIKRGGIEGNIRWLIASGSGFGKYSDYGKSRFQEEEEECDSRYHYRNVE